MLSKIDLGKGLGFWKTMPTRRRSSTTSTSGALMSWPSRRIFPSIRVPGMTSFMRLRVRMKVDLPHPEGPMMAVTLRAWQSIVTFLRARVAP